MTDDDDDLRARVARLEHILNEVKAMVRALQDRLTTAEQGLAQKWIH